MADRTIHADRVPHCDESILSWLECQSMEIGTRRKIRSVLTIAAKLNTARQ